VAVHTLAIVGMLFVLRPVPTLIVPSIDELDELIGTMGSVIRLADDLAGTRNGFADTPLREGYRSVDAHE
jgi:hypothetical protein